MSLTIYLNEQQIPKDIEIIRDIEKSFTYRCMSNTETVRRLLKDIEQADYNDDNSFIDRFGFKLSCNMLSTGTKAALCINAFQDKVIDIKECGTNARNSIIRLLNEGSILWTVGGLSFEGYTEEIDVRVGDKVIKTVGDLNRYLQLI